MKVIHFSMRRTDQRSLLRISVSDDSQSIYEDFRRILQLDSGSDWSLDAVAFFEKLHKPEDVIRAPARSSDHLVTGLGGMANLAKARALGVRELLMKPLTAQSLGEAVHRVLTSSK